MTKRLVRVRLYDPKATGDVPAAGVVECRPTLRRHIEGGDPDDFIVLPAKFTSRLGAALDYIDANDDEQTAAATDGVAWFWIDATDDGPYANLWAWTFTERTSGGMTRTVAVPAGAGIVEYGDLVDIDLETGLPELPTVTFDIDGGDAVGSYMPFEIDGGSAAA
jgi:hypothetical protein